MRRPLVVGIVLVMSFLYLFLGTGVEFPVVKDFSVGQAEYSSSEIVNATYSRLQVQDCSCMDPRMRIYRRNGSEWKELVVDADMFVDPVCVDGRPPKMIMCDLVQCDLSPGIERTSFSWDQEYIVLTGEEVDSCSTESGRTINQTFKQARTVQASPGMYKMKVGSFEEKFRIK